MTLCHCQLVLEKEMVGPPVPAAAQTPLDCHCHCLAHQSLMHAGEEHICLG